MQIIATIIFATIVIGIVTLVSGFIWMLALGVAADAFNKPELALSYWQSCIVAIFANMILGGIGRARSTN